MLNKLLDLSRQFFLVMACVVAGISFSYAQWTTNEDDIYNTNTGSVGIGTGSPSSTIKLDIYAPGMTGIRTKGILTGNYCAPIGRINASF